ncbi:hypothetical protein FXO38_21361 [Capsicum annuum]|nr:hypothetical protein FXO38_21361 [Capsicum annuum]
MLKQVEPDELKLSLCARFGKSFITAGCGAYPISNTVNEHPSASLRPVKKVRDVEPTYSQQKLQISLNNNYGQNEVEDSKEIIGLPSDEFADKVPECGRLMLHCSELKTIHMLNMHSSMMYEAPLFL